MILTSKLYQYLKLTRKTKQRQKIDDNVMSVIYDVIVFIPISGQFGPIPKPDSGRVVCKTYFFIKSNLLSYENWKQN